MNRDNKDYDITIALAGNANVGKSVIFNELTGMNQVIGNWPGKTVELQEGYFEFEGKKVRVVDLPGIYSLSTFSQEEVISREFIIEGDVDVVINIVDATSLERNLYFTLQLLELEVPVVLALNQYDLALKRGILLNKKRLEEILSIDVVETVAIEGKGIKELVEASLKNLKQRKRKIISYGKEVEGKILENSKFVENFLSSKNTPFYKKFSLYPSRFIAIKLLEKDEEILKLFKGTEVEEKSKAIQKELEEIHGEEITTIIAQERYSLISKIIKEIEKIEPKSKTLFIDKIDSILLNRVSGYIFLVVALFLIFEGIFLFGDFLSPILEGLLSKLQYFINLLPLKEFYKEFIWRGFFEGLIAGITIALPYIIPFYIILSWLENSGYLARIAFLVDYIMHLLGLHGKAFIPILLGYGCNVPAVLGTRIMERDRDRFIAGVLATLVPCSARTVVLLGLTGVFLGFQYALLLYVLNLLIIFITGRILNKFLPGKPTGLIMEMPKLKVPPLKLSLKQSWFRLKDFIFFAFPIIIVGSFLLYLIELLGWNPYISSFFAPIIEGWLGLPAIIGIVLILGILRKELALIMLAALLHTQDFSLVLSSRQMLVFSFVVMLYIPCIATIAALKREFGLKRAITVSILEIVFAVFLGGILNKILLLLKWN